MLSRRNVLRTAGAAAIYKVVNSGFTMKAAAANDQIGMGFIGTGVRGTYLLDQFKDMPGVRPVIVADLYDGYLRRAKAQTGGAIATTKRYEEVINNREVDAVCIATPDHWHERMITEALDAGKHVYVEKPMTWDIPEGKRIRAAVEASGKLLQVGSQWKTSAVSERARELIKQGALGQVSMVQMANHRNTPEGAWVWPIPPDASTKTCDWERFLGDKPRRPWHPETFFRWRCWWEFSGGVATDLFVHLLTQLHYVMDVKAPSSVVSQGGLWRWRDGRNVPDVLHSMYEYPEGFIADMYVNLANAFPLKNTLIMGTEATLELTPRKIVIYPENVQTEVQHYGTYGWPADLKAAYYQERGYTADGKPKTPPPPKKQPKEIPVPSKPSHYEQFIIALREGKESPESAAEGHYAAGAGHLANIAYRRKRQTWWDPDAATVEM